MHILFIQRWPEPEAGGVWCSQVVDTVSWYIVYERTSEGSSGHTAGHTEYCSMDLGLVSHTMRCRYNAVDFLHNLHKRHPIAHPLGWAMGCLLWIQIRIYVLLQPLQWCVQKASYIGLCYNSTWLYQKHLIRYGYSHYKYQTVMRLSYHYNWNSYSNKTMSLYWKRQLTHWGLK